LEEESHPVRRVPLEPRRRWHQPQPRIPNLAGQYADYLETALKHYQNGKRKNPIMAAQVKDLKNKDIQDLAAFFSSQRALSVKH
jgi:cytochrome c553